jgi:hypothetical protein
METESKREILEKIANSNSEALINKISKLIKQEEANNFWVNATNELRAELETDIDLKDRLLKGVKGKIK